MQYISYTTYEVVIITEWQTYYVLFTHYFLTMSYGNYKNIILVDQVSLEYA